MTFTVYLHYWLDLEELADIRKKTDLDPDSGVCYTHDHLDSNQVMLDAMDRFGFTEYTSEDEEMGDLMDKAWTMAKKARFQLRLETK